MKKQFQSLTEKGRWLLATLTLIFTLGIGQMWAADYTLAASTFNSDKNAATVDGQTFTLDQAHAGTGQTGYSNYIKFSKGKTYVMTLPTGFALTNINIKGYTNSNGKTDGAIAEIGGNSQSGKTFPAKDDSNLGSKTQITDGYDFAISQTGGTVAIKTANTNQICVLITITGTPAGSGTDETAPAFVSSNPSNSATNVAVEGTIVLTFDEAIASVDGSKFSLSGATKGTVAIDGTDSKKVNVPYSGAENEATVTLSVAAAAVEDAAGNKSAVLSDISFTTIAAAAPVECPESGVVYSMNLKSGASTRSLKKGVSYDLTSSDVTIERGSASIKNIDGSSDGKMQISSGPKFYFNGNNAYVKIDLDCPLQEGDKIEIAGGSGTQIAITPTEGTPKDQTLVRTTSSYKYTVTAADVTAGFVGSSVKTYYLGRSSGSGTYMTGITITRPYNISFSSAKGTAPSATKGFEVELAQITGVDGWVHTGWTANAAVKVGSTDKAAGAALDVDATVTVSSDVTFTATWEEDIPAVDPTITFNDGAYTIGGAALDLSTLFTSTNTTGAVTYTVKTAGETGAAIDGVNFTATAAGEATVTATQAASLGFNQKAVDATITISAPSEVDGIKMVEAGALTGNFRTSQSLTTLSGSDKYTIAGLDYTKYIKFGSSVSSWSAVAGPSNKYLAYTPTKKTTNFYFYVHNNSNSASYINLYLIEEGNDTPTKVQVSVTANENALKTYELNITKNTEVYITAESNNVYFCQAVAVESGDDLLKAPGVGYEINLNKGRLSTTSGVATTLEGITYYLGSGYSIASGSNISIGTKGTHYVSFEIPTGQTRQLKLTTGNKSAYTVSKTLGDDANPYTPANNGETKNWNLTAGKWYINPQGSNVQITKIAFAAAPDQVNVVFNSNGGSEVEAQALFAGDKATEPTAPTREGYRFVKWQKAGVDYDFDATVTTGFTLDAVWQKIWTVTFNSDGGSDVAAATVDDGQVVAAPAEPTKAGNTFDYWYKVTGEAGQEDVAYVFSTPVAADMTLKAHWTELDDDATLQYLEVDGVEVPVPADGIYRMVADYGHNPVVTAATTSSSGASRDIYNVPTHSDDEGGYDYVQVVVTAHDGVTVKYYQIRYTHAPKLGVELIKATHTGASTASKVGYWAADVTIDKNTQGGGKLGSNDHYFGLKLGNDKKFMNGDVVVVYLKEDQTPSAWLQLFSDKGSTMIADLQSGVRKGANYFTLSGLDAAGIDELYVYRTSTADSKMNPYVEYIAVYHLMAPFIEEFKFGDDVATINEGAKTISIDVPYGTDVTALTPTVKYWGNGGGAITPEGEQDFTSAVNYTVSSAYAEDATGDYAPVTYAVTVNVAAPSENAYLASLSVAGYALDFDKDVTSYDVVLDYGTTALPAISYEVEDTGLAEAVKEENGVNGATTITVTPQAGAGYEKVYTINFSVSTTPKFVIFDGSTMTDYAESGSDLGTGFAWAVVGGNHSEKSAGVTLNGKTYTTGQNIFTSPTASNTRYIEITIPDGYFAKFYLAGATNSKDETRSSFISKEKTGTLDESIAYASSDQYSGAVMESSYQLPGTYYYCATKSIRLYELSIKLYPIDKQRTLTPGMLATVCLPNSGVMLGASIFEVAYYDVDSKKIFFDEVEGGVMEAGMPYIVLANEGSTQFAVKYTGSENAAAQTHHGLAGWLGAEKSLAENEYFIYDNKYYYVNAADAASGRVRITAEHAYIPNIADVPGYGGTPYPAPAPGRRRVALDAQGTQVATGIEGVEATEITVQKVLINGQMYILRGEQMYDATGRLVK